MSPEIICAPNQTPVVRSCSLIPRIRSSKIRIAPAHVVTSSMVKAELNFLEKGSFAFSWAVALLVFPRSTPGAVLGLLWSFEKAYHRLRYA